MKSLDRSYRYVEAWGMTSGSDARIYRPVDVEGVAEALRLARASGQPLGLRGTGNSYGDASMNSLGSVLDISRMRRILSFDDATGVVEVEGGVSLRQLWQYTLPRGYWPRVVSGTSFPSLAGLASMNIHGKNNFAVGTIGKAIIEFDLMLPSGECLTCSRESNADVFHGAIGGLGMLGVFTRIKLHTKRVHSGNLLVHSYANRNMADLMEFMQERRNGSDYLVAWVDCFARGKALGRGAIHQANYLARGEDIEPERTRSLVYQSVKPNVFGALPKGELWRPLRLLNNDAGFRFINSTKYHLGIYEAWCKPRHWTLNEFSFLLDYVPNWKWSYGRKPGTGLIQFQPFVPDESAHDVFCEILERSHAMGHTPYLGVIKRHRPDPFLLTHAVDGWSFALDYKVTPETRERVFQFCRELVELVLAAGGKFYFAKDSVLPSGAVERMYPEADLQAFRALKARLDPETLLATDLWRRAFA